MLWGSVLGLSGGVLGLQLTLWGVVWDLLLEGVLRLQLGLLGRGLGLLHRLSDLAHFSFKVSQYSHLGPHLFEL